MKRYIVYLFLPLLCFILVAETNGQVLNTNMPEFDGYVRAVAEHGDTVFVGGGFSKAFYQEHNYRRIASVDRLSDQKKGNKLPGSNGVIYKILPDGFGGAYLGGSFTRVGDSVRLGLAHVDSTGKVTDKLASTKVSGYVKTMKLRNDTLYFGGGFTTVGKISQAGGVGISDSGTIQKFMPVTNGSINVCLPDSNGGWYVGGNFSVIGGLPRKNLAHIDSNGLVYPWDPNLDGPVFSMIVNGNALIAGGAFNTAGGVLRRNLVSIDKIAGTINGWSPSANGAVYTMLKVGSKLYLGGDFLQINSTSRFYAAAIDINTGGVTAWDPNADATVRAMAIKDSHIYIGGDFTYLKGYAMRVRIAMVDTNSGQPASWSPQVNGTITKLLLYGNNLLVVGVFSKVDTIPKSQIAIFNSSTGQLMSKEFVVYGGEVKDVLLVDTTLYVAGGFNRVGRGVIDRSYLAAFNFNSGEVVNWSPIVNNKVITINSYNGLVYGFGSFDIASGIKRRNIASVTISSEKICSWAFNTDNTVNAIEFSEQTMYIGGNFFTVSGEMRVGVASIDMHNWTLTSWAPRLFYGVLSMLNHNNVLYVGGSFDHVNDTISRSSIAAFDLATGNLTTWNPGVNGTVYSMVADSDHIYIGGSFNYAGGKWRYGVAGISTNTGIASAMKIGVGDSRTVTALAIYGDTLYIGGPFDYLLDSNSISNSSFIGHKSRIAAINKNTGAVFNWSPPLSVTGPSSPFNVAYPIEIVPLEKTVIFSGPFECSIEGEDAKNLVAISKSSGKLLNWDFKTSNAVESLFIRDSLMFIGGWFTSILDQPRTSLAVLNLRTGNLTPFSPLIKTSSQGNGSAVTQIQFRDSVIYFSGIFDSVNNVSRRAFAEMNLYTASLSSWDPKMDQNNSCIQVEDSILYVGGGYSTLNLSPKNKLAAVSLNTHQTKSWNPLLSLSKEKNVKTLAVAKNSIFIGGYFDSVSTVSQRYIAEVDKFTGLLKPRALSTNGGVESIKFNKNGHMYVSGVYTRINNEPFAYYSVIDTSNNAIINWNPQINNACRTDLVVGNTCYLGGAFTSVLAEPRKYFAAMTSEDYSQKIYILSKAICPGDSLLVAYKFSLRPNKNNTCVAELSDYFGNFTTFTTIGSVLNSSDTGVIYCKIPHRMYPGNYRVRVRSTNPNFTGISDSTFIIRPLSMSAFSVNAPDQCLGTANVICNDVSGTSTLSRKWYMNGISVYDTTVAVSKTFTATGKYYIALTTKNVFGCSDSSSQVITVHEPVHALFSINDSSQCFEGNSFKITNESSVQSGQIYCNWHFGDNTMDTVYSLNKSFLSSGAYVVQLIVYNSGCSDTMSKIALVRPNPFTPSLFYSPDTVACSDVPILLKTNSLDVKSWMKNGTALGITTDSLVVTNSPGSYSLKVTNTENCDATSTVANLFFKPTPVKPIITVSGNVLTSSSTTGNQWYSSTGAIAGETGQTYLASSIGQYYTIVTLNGCPSPASDMANFPATGITSISKDNSISVYPNPNNGSFTIVPDKKIDGEVLVKLFDLTGRIVFEEVRNDNNLSIQTTGLANGTYLLVIQTNDGLSKVKIAINR